MMAIAASLSSLVVVALAGIYLLALGMAALFVPRLARPFLAGFAESAGKHYLELGVRLLVGAAFIGAAPTMVWPLPARVFGWLLVGTTAVLCFVPWHLHRRFAEYSVARVTPHLRAVGVASVCAGAAVLASVYAAGAA